MSTTTGRLAKQTTVISNDLQEMGAIVKDAAQEKFAELRQDASECCENGQDQVRDVVTTVEEYVRKQPLKSILISAAVGLLFGRYWLRR